MDSTELLKEIGLGLETMADKIWIAIATNESSSDRAEWAGVAAHRAAPTEKVTFVECRNDPCENHEDGDLCGKDRPTCPNRITRTVVAVRRGPCYNTDCERHGGVSCCHATDFCSSMQREKLLQGYTLAQWGAIREGGYLCEFGGSKLTPWTLGTLRTASSPSEFGVFVCSKGGHYEYCRPAQIPGVLRPWFGGERPVNGDTTVMCKFANGHVGVVAANSRLWSWGDAVQSDITAYMEV